MQKADKEDLELRAAALAGDKWAVGRLCSLFEDKRKESIEARAAVLKTLAQSKEKRQAKFIGFTGPPGVGKSTLIASLIRHILKQEKEMKIAVLAVDPSSALSGGSFLGDRQRMLAYSDMEGEAGKERFFFRSQSAEQELGGLSQSSFITARLLYYLFDWVCIETVGIGQNEIEIQFLADCTVMLLQPSSGDQIQFLKAGIMEVPDIFVLNKCDLDLGAKKAVHSSLQALRSGLDLNRPSQKDNEIPILLSSAHKGQGIPELAQVLLTFPPSPYTWQDKEKYYLAKWIQHEFGRQGLYALQVSEKESLALKKSKASKELIGEGKLSDILKKEHDSFETAQLYVWEKLLHSLPKGS